MSRKEKMEKLAEDRRNADQGDFFFVGIYLSNGKPTKRPVFVVGKRLDSNDSKDVIVCMCTTKPKRSKYDIEVTFREKSVVRTNKIYTVSKELLLFKLPQRLEKHEVRKIVSSANKAIKLK
ncbi:type II toxin-antitoxin system PemK/MazF family toxin [Bacillaceae bacterium SIJ1]|uniref:type II toxin-antitoxin system PemK/MazF family toxin n=1 Tax=Litoribacterium kuwaitense TaxID=1398745 RepID=UPI0013EDB5B1|nr:type II toxin-antitoxin system PemK/MazF family toxin [Litoribacterium kuwaitense]NGP43858.1 type II toxin-antitoxin system PemK/MazF family toxin [Litoribacterium kuwaitense]